jgi:hypothetical protein
VRGWESGDRVPSVATLHRIVDAYCFTDEYVAQFDTDGIVPPDVEVQVLIEQRAKWMASRREGRRRREGRSS